MAINKYLVLAKVVEHGTITKAAESLNYTQSAVSQIINNLEKEMGFPLLIRGKTGITLTENGKIIVEPLQKMLNWEAVLEQRQKNIVDLKEGTLKISTLTSSNLQWLPSIIASFLKKHPNVEFDIAEGNYDKVQEDIINDDADCGFLSDQYTKDLLFTPLMTDEFLVVMPKGHKLCRSKAIAPADLEAYPFILPTEGPNYEVGTLLKNNFDIHIRIYNQDDYSALSLVEQGMGLTILPQLILDSAVGTFVTRPLKPALTRTLGIALHNKAYASPLALEFVSFATAWISGHYTKS